MSADGATGPRGIFISYRRDDLWDAAKSLRDKLGERFGRDSIYFDVDEQPGVDWEARIRERGKHADLFLTIIGPRWLSELQVRTAAAKSSGAVDYVRREIEWALCDWPGEVIPVLIGVSMPSERELPRSIKGLCRKQAVAIRPDSFDADVAQLVTRLEQVRPADTPPDQDTDRTVDAPDGSAPAAVERPRATGVPQPTEDHYREVIRGMTRGMVVPWLGASVRGALPDSRFLASQLAQEFSDLKLQSSDLAEIAQSILIREGRRELQESMRELIKKHSEPIHVHRFLAALPGRLRRRDLPASYQLIISTNYDRALERAFEDVNEPFDYAIYMPSTGRFVHFPWGEEDDKPRAVTINDPGNYFDFPITDDYRLKRTVIVKVHGSPTFWEGTFEWEDDYVVTEDQYIDYLPTHAIEDYLPRQLLDQLTGSRCLFLGYTLREWSARVLLRRLWPAREMAENSWAIEDGPDDLEKRSWGAIARMELFDACMSDYVSGLSSALAVRLDDMAPAGAVA
jgi:SIR2-like domain/TIR domain